VKLATSFRNRHKPTLSVLLLLGLEKDYAVWRHAFWKTVENGLKRHRTLTTNDKACECSTDDMCSCKMDRIPHSSSEVQLANFVYMI